MANRTPPRQQPQVLDHNKGGSRRYAPLEERGRHLPDVDYLAEISAIKREYAERGTGLSSLHISPRDAGRATAVMALGGRMLAIHRSRPAAGQRHDRIGGPRSRIAGFSHASRRRLMVKLNSLDRRHADLRGALITLTYPGEFTHDPTRWKRDLDTLYKRLVRHWGRFGVFWKLEFQKRGAPDIHLLAYDPQARLCTYGFRQWLSEAWYEVVGSGDERHLRAGTRVERPRHARALESYCTKYVGKPEPGITSVGRFWGVWNGALLPVSTLILDLGAAEYTRAARTIRRLLRNRGHRRTARHVYLPHCEALRLLHWALAPPAPA